MSSYIDDESVNYYATRDEEVDVAAYGDYSDGYSDNSTEPTAEPASSSPSGYSDNSGTGYSGYSDNGGYSDNSAEPAKAAEAKKEGSAASGYSYTENSGYEAHEASETSSDGYSYTEQGVGYSDTTGDDSSGYSDNSEPAVAAKAAPTGLYPSYRLRWPKTLFLRIQVC
jgi:hypothetical protein